MKMKKLGKRNKMRQLDKMFADNRQKILYLKMQRPEKKKFITVKQQAGEVISKNIFHQEGNKSEKKVCS